MDDFQRLLDMENIRHFDADEVFRRNPPPDLWQNIIPTLRVLDKVREHYDIPIIVNSSYRDPAYNRRVGGKPDSLHLAFNAIDFTVKTLPLRAIYSYMEYMPGAESFGLGIYNTFIHLDTRGMIGRKAPARWDERKKNGRMV